VHDLTSPPRAAAGVIAFILVCEFALTILFVSPWFPMQALGALQQATGGWIAITLLASATFGGIGVWIALRHGGQDFASLGWRVRDLAPALVVLVGAWLLLQIIAISAHGGPPVPTTAVADGRWGRVFGPVLAQLGGTALMEETLYRAFLWPQLRLRFAAVMPPRRATILALFASQAIFALMHIPIRVYQGAVFADLGGMLLMLFASGIVLALVYAATRNLLIAVAIHALSNAPTLVVEPAGPSPGTLMLGVCVFVCVAWPLARLRGSRGWLASR